MKQSAGILVFRWQDRKLEVMLVHPGGPFWSKKDTWSIPKGELEPDEDLLMGARREFAEEVGAEAPDGELIDLGQAKQGGKVNYIWAIEGAVDLSHVHEARPYNMVSLEWPPHSGKQLVFAENDRADWFAIATAHSKVFKYQAVFLERLAELVGVPIDADEPPELPRQQSLL